MSSMKSDYFLSVTKIPFLCFLLLAFLFLLNHAVFAQSSDCVVTKVGTPDASVPKPTCPGETGQQPEPETGRPGQPLPSEDTEDIKRKLCEEYKVCPTEGTVEPPAPGWTLQQLTALWNIVQKIYESPTYKTRAIGNFTLELSRSKSYPGRPDFVWGFHANSGLPNYHVVPNSRLIIVADKVNEAATTGVLEWFFAHEIAHAASFGSELGDWTPSVIGQSPGYQAVLACNEIVSKYGVVGGPDENYADTVAYYMTPGEQVTTYYGPTIGDPGDQNLRTDHPCSYNALKENYFNGVEY